MKFFQAVGVGILAFPVCLGLAGFLGLLWGTFGFVSAWTYANLVLAYMR